MRKTWFALLLAALLLMSGLTASASEYQEGDVVENFELRTLDGQTLSLNALLEEKQAVVLNFWFVDCPWCAYEFPDLQKFAQNHEQDVAVLTVNSYDSESAIREFAQENDLNLPLAIEDGSLTERFVTEGFPTTVVIGKDATLHAIKIGAAQSDEEFETLVAPLLTPADTTQAQTAQYVFRTVNEEGKPVSGVTLYICGDLNCRALTSDENGEIRFEDVCFPYQAHILAVPEGYAEDSETTYELKDGQTELTVTVAKK